MNLPASLIAAALFASLGAHAAPVVQEARDQYMGSLKALCGQRFEGQMQFPSDPKHDFAGKRLVADFAKCSDTEVRVPFIVGEDRSRTWVITRTASGLELRHDHRHADGTPDAVTMYGGYTRDAGTPLSQSFGADGHTARIVNGAATNVWTLSLSPDGNTLTYHLERDARPRFTAVLQRLPAK